MLTVSYNFDNEEDDEIQFETDTFYFAIDLEDVKQYTPQEWRDLLTIPTACIYSVTNPGFIEHQITNRGDVLEFLITHKKGILQQNIPITDCKDAINWFADELEKYSYKVDGEKFQEFERSFQEIIK